MKAPPLSAAAEAMDTASHLLAGRGYLDASAELTRALGPRLATELGWNVAPGHTLGAYGYVEPQDAGIGVRYRWNW